MLDILIRNGMVVDGTGKPAFRADVMIDKGTVVGVGTAEATARAAGRALARAGAVGFFRRTCLAMSMVSGRTL